MSVIRLIIMRGRLRAPNRGSANERTRLHHRRRTDSLSTVFVYKTTHAQLQPVQTVGGGGEGHKKEVRFEVHRHVNGGRGWGGGSFYTIFTFFVTWCICVCRLQTGGDDFVCRVCVLCERESFGYTIRLSIVVVSIIKYCTSSSNICIILGKCCVCSCIIVRIYVLYLYEYKNVQLSMSKKYLWFAVARLCFDCNTKNAVFVCEFRTPYSLLFAST